LRKTPIVSDSGHGESTVVAGLDPAIHPFRKKMDARVKPHTR
jgi:hypothetical protein